VLVADSNAQAARMAAFLVSEVAAAADARPLTEAGKK